MFPREPRRLPVADMAMIPLVKVENGFMVVSFCHSDTRRIHASTRSRYSPGFSNR